MDLQGVRTFVTVADRGRFQDAAAELAITQQAVSKRIAGLEQSLGVRLFTRDRRGARLTVDGQTFLPRARDLLAAADRAADAVHPGRRPLRVDVVANTSAPAALVHEHRLAQPDGQLDVVSLPDTGAALDAVQDGSIDATFRAVAASRLPAGVKATRVLDDAVHLLVGPRHEFARARAITVAQVVGRRVWLPPTVVDTEWSDYYAEFAETFGLTLDPAGRRGDDASLMATLADSSSVATLVSERTALLWPEGYDLRRIPLTEPTPIYPYTLIWRADNHHTGLDDLREHLFRTRSHRPRPRTWVPRWARRTAATAES